MNPRPEFLLLGDPDQKLFQHFAFAGIQTGTKLGFVLFSKTADCL
jgi:hypothetical protein